MTKILL